jgi:1-acyl-sn-glycerol-3-phosphate acyltransferase
MAGITQSALENGNVMVFANHPSLIETFVVRYVLDRVTSGSVWSMADENLFPRKWYAGFQCIPVSRVNDVAPRHARRVNAAACRFQDHLLTSKGIVVTYPEGTRTCKAARYHTLADRTVGECHCGLLERAVKKGATLIPLWIDFGNCRTPQGFLRGYGKLLVTQPMTLTFGEPYTGPITPAGIAQALLQAGMTTGASS